MNRLRKQGFTLIELIVVMAILAIITMGLFGTFSSSQKKSRDSQRKSDLKQVQNALEMYANDNRGLYPADDDGGKIMGCPIGTACEWDLLSEFYNDTTTPNVIYLKKMVKDPLGTTTYYYEQTQSGKGYRLYALLENEEDQAITKAGCQKIAPNGTGCPNKNDYNYGAASSNESL